MNLEVFTERYLRGRLLDSKTSLIIYSLAPHDLFLIWDSYLKPLFISVCHFTSPAAIHPYTYTLWGLPESNF